MLRNFNNADSLWDHQQQIRCCEAMLIFPFEADQNKTRSSLHFFLNINSCSEFDDD